jgi:thioredoxin 1
MLDFPTAVIEASKAHPLLVFFRASWCPHCRRLAPTLAEVAERHHLPLVSIDVDEEQELAQEHGVTSFPDVRLWHQGRETAGFTGDRPLPEVEQWLRDNLTVTA